MTQKSAFSPPLAALRIFVSAARLLSFSRAAQEHGLSPSAVTQAIARLETGIGVALFSRAVRSVALTPAGAKLFAASAAALRDIDLTVQAIAPRSGSLVRLTAPPTWTALWLMPRLSSFTSVAPGVDVEVDASSRLVDIEAEGFDFGIRYAESLPGHFKRVELFKQCYVPVCAPEVAKPIRQATDFSRTRLLHESDVSRWSGWFEAAAVASTSERAKVWDGATGLYFSQGTLAVNAAIRGLGVALTEPDFVAEELRSGQLAQPIDLRWHSGHTYHAVWSSRSKMSPPARLFLDWIKKQCVSMPGSPHID